MGKKLDIFEQGVKHAIEHVELPLDPNAWGELEAKLDALNTQVSSTNSSTGFTQGFFTGALATAALVTAMSLMQSPIIETEAEAQITNHVQQATPKNGGTRITTLESKTVEEPVQLETLRLEPTQKASQIVVERVKNKNTSITESATKFEEKEGNVEQQNQVSQDYEIRLECDRKILCLGENPHLVITSLGLFEEDRFLVNGKESKEPIRFEEPGIYEIVAQGKIENNWISSKPIEIEVLERPNISVDRIQDTDIYGRSRYTFNANHGNSVAMEWFANNHLAGSEEPFEFTPVKQDLYEIMAIAIDESGCRDTAYSTVNITSDYNLLAPTAFTPDGDGRNDYWMPKALSGIDVPFTLSIFDSKGNRVFETSDPYAVWSGKVKGEPVTTGAVYVWKAVVEFEEGKSNFSGTITIVE